MMITREWTSAECGGRRHPPLGRPPAPGPIEPTSPDHPMPMPRKPWSPVSVMMPAVTVLTDHRESLSGTSGRPYLPGDGNSGGDEFGQGLGDQRRRRPDARGGAGGSR